VSDEEKSIKSSVMSQIKSGEVRMRPRLYYAALASLSIGAVLLTGVVLAYLSSIMFYWVRIQTATTRARGARANLEAALASFPWWILLLALLLVISAVYLVKRHGRMYRHRTSTVFLIILLCSMLLGLGLSQFDIGKSHGPNRQNQPHQRGPGWRNQ
jgi:cytochrome bd-type quinol oxidase subunit 2